MLATFPHYLYVAANSLLLICEENKVFWCVDLFCDV